MKIYFEPTTKDKVFFRIKSFGITETRGFFGAAAEAKLGEDNLNELISKMETLFTTMTWDYTGLPYGFIFRFEGWEDYDYFSVWSSQGVEI